MHTQRGEHTGVVPATHLWEKQLEVAPVLSMYNELIPIGCIDADEGDRADVGCIDMGRRWNCEIHEEIMTVLSWTQGLLYDKVHL